METGRGGAGAATRRRYSAASWKVQPQPFAPEAPRSRLCRPPSRKRCKIARRKVDEVTLIAVSKTHPPEKIEPLLEAGHRVFGENRVQEAQGKWPALRERYPRCAGASDRPAAIEQGGGCRARCSIASTRSTG